jgi:hypothetical protein
MADLWQPEEFSCDGLNAASDGFTGDGQGFASTAFRLL